MFVVPLLVTPNGDDVIRCSVHIHIYVFYIKMSTQSLAQGLYKITCGKPGRGGNSVGDVNIFRELGGRSYWG